MSFTTTRRVEFGDTDMAGIVHFANFFRYMEAAETEFYRSRGFTVNWRGDDGEEFGFPRVSAQCDYRKPAKFEDVLVIEVTVEHLGSRSIRCRFDFRRDEVELATGRMTCVFCRKTDRGLESADIPDHIRKRLEG